MTDLDCPNDLSEDGKKAYKAIMTFLQNAELTYTGCCKAFYSPKEWREKEELYGLASKLIIVHDGGDLARCFNVSYEDTESYEGMIAALATVGLYSEQCTSYYSAIY